MSFTGKRADKVSLWKERFLEYQASGVSTKEYCLSKSLALSTFKYWKSYFEGGSVKNTAKFVSISEGVALPPRGIQILLPNGVRIAMSGCREKSLEHLFSTLGGL
ncbi:MAG: hypothetical protein Q8R79_08580 [Legionellaceae bacterium]|nr:hypothetical protein [Legionellaceae bacterium]